jgi:hypothetical protein
MCTPDPDLFSIPDAGSNNTKKRGENKLVVLPFFIAISFSKSKKYFNFLTGTAKDLSQLTKFQVFFI